MCFSSTASFVVSGVLTGVGAARQSLGTHPHHTGCLRTVPLTFAAQQAAEGFVWLTDGGSAHVLLHRLGINAYLGFALIVWPMWFPFALLLAE
jgi:hypothetical protein